jgi:hypothetical protein
MQTNGGLLGMCLLHVSGTTIHNNLVHCVHLGVDHSANPDVFGLGRVWEPD